MGFSYPRVRCGFAERIGNFRGSDINKMSRHIHAPEISEWVAFLANSAEIDGYSVSENELYRIRTAVVQRKFALSLTNCANVIWDYATGQEPITISSAALHVNKILSENAVAEGFIQYGSLTEGDYRTGDPVIDSRTFFKPEMIPSFLSCLDSRIYELDLKALDYLERGFSPMYVQTELGMASWLTQFQLGYTCPFPCLNGLTGRFLTNCLRLRWSMTFWRCDLKTGVWESNLNQCKQLWKRLPPEEIVKPLRPEGYKPSLEKPEILDPKA